MKGSLRSLRVRPGPSGVLARPVPHIARVYMHRRRGYEYGVVGQGGSAVSSSATLVSGERNGEGRTMNPVDLTQHLHLSLKCVK